MRELIKEDALNVAKIKGVTLTDSELEGLILDVELYLIDTMKDRMDDSIENVLYYRG